MSYPLYHVTENVNTAFSQLAKGLIDEKVPYVEEESRNGTVLRIGHGPSVVTYMKPTQRVLFNPGRDCNPFFHVFEALWMLAGRNDLAPIKYYLSSFGNYSDDGEILNGAYGYRWRHAHIRPPAQETGEEKGGIDQLKLVKEQLMRDSSTRRAVLNMWNVADDLLKVGYSLDVCCNLNAVFEINKGRLNMTVFNRSNDLIWGMLGANAVHFSILQEYMASLIGCKVGMYSQVSNNLHVYKEIFDRDSKKWFSFNTMHDFSYRDCERHVPLVDIPSRFIQETESFIDNQEGVFFEPFIRDVAQPMCLAFRHHKERDYARALEATNWILDNAWRYASRQWLNKRQKNYEARTNKV